MTRDGIARHLPRCENRRDVAAKAAEGSGRDAVFFHLQVRDAWDGDYWLHLEVDGSASLDDLDDYLRDIWLECCGHLSEFSTGIRGGARVPMTRRVHQVLAPEMELTHVYDFGTSSVTLIKGVDRRVGKKTTVRPIALMARNAPPVVGCQECDEPATHLCVECRIEEDRHGVLCAEHAARHPHEDYGEPIPLVNSPRMGLCGYTGPAETPY